MPPPPPRPLTPTLPRPEADAHRTSVQLNTFAFHSCLPLVPLQPGLRRGLGQRGIYFSGVYLHACCSAASLVHTGYCVPLITAGGWQFPSRVFFGVACQQASL